MLTTTIVDLQFDYFEHYNELTTFMDNYLLFHDSYTRTSITSPGEYYPDSNAGVFYSMIMVSGMLRGQLEMDRYGVIENISLYEDVCFSDFGCYDMTITSDIETFIGRKLNFET